MRPDLRFKDDAPLGVVLRYAHLQPHMIRILQVALDTAPRTDDGAVWVTEAWRSIRPTLDFHELCAAFDFRCKNIIAVDRTEREAIAHLWSIEMDDILGEDYDVIAHGDGDNFHIHAEYDPR